MVGSLVSDMDARAPYVGCAAALRPRVLARGIIGFAARGVRQLEQRATVSTHTAQTAPASARPQASPRVCVRAAARQAYEHTAQAV